VTRDIFSKVSEYLSKYGYKLVQTHRILRRPTKCFKITLSVF
jgi:hypothetical protein